MTGYSNPDYLYRLARSGSSEDRETLAKSITSLLHSDLSKGEMFLAQDILLHMLREAEMDLRQSLALHLSEEANCPQALLDFLVYECPLSVSAPVLKNSPVLTDEYLIDVAKRFDVPEYWRTIAARKQISRNLALFLIGSDDEEVYQILVRNHGSEFCSLCMNWLTGIALNLPPLQEPLLQRKEITAELASKIYWHTSEQLQQQIIQRFNIDPKVIEQAMQHAVTKKLDDKKKVQAITPEMLAMVQRIPKISTRQIMESMQKGDRALFACLCGVHLSVDPEQVVHKLETRPLLAMAVLCRALNVTRAEYNSLFLMWRRHDSPASITNARELSHAMAVFDQMKPEDAKAEAASWAVDTQLKSAMH